MSTIMWNEEYKEAHSIRTNKAVMVLIMPLVLAAGLLFLVHRYAPDNRAALVLTAVASAAYFIWQTIRAMTLLGTPVIAICGLVEDIQKEDIGHIAQHYLLVSQKESFTISNKGLGTAVPIAEPQKKYPIHNELEWQKMDPVIAIWCCGEVLRLRKERQLRLDFESLKPPTEEVPALPPSL